MTTVADPEPAPDPDSGLPRMTLGEHLDELRRRVGRSVLVILLGTIVAFIFNARIWDAALAPYREVAGTNEHLRPQSPLDGFVQPFKLAFIVALVATSPYALYQMWGFISAGLYDHEKKAVRIFFPVSVVLFALGLLTAFLIILPVGLKFLTEFSRSHDMSAEYAVGDYLSLCLSLVFGMGIAFELPLVMLFLQAVGIVERASLEKRWRVAILVAFVLAMLLTPDPSPVSQTLMAGPLIMLWFLGVWGGRFVGEQKERLTVLKSWPLALVIGLFVALFLFRAELREFASRIVSSDAKPAPATPPAPAGTPGMDK